MDFKKIICNDNSIVLKNVENFNIKQIAECGQCFRWKKIKELDYVGVAYERVIEVIQKDDTVTILNSTKDDFYNIWLEYFDLHRDYTSIKKELSKDPILKESVKYGYGIRILNQEPFEMLISFIISARNSIPVISRTIERISKKYGKKITYNGETYYAFPNIQEISGATEDEIRETGASFRSKYIVDTINNLLNNEDESYNLDYIKELNDDLCHTELQKFKGVGSKVADCIMLFSMKKTSAFPVDVWVKRAMIHFYGIEDVSLNKIRIFARNKFKELSGFAQQYLFYNARENRINID